MNNFPQIFLKRFMPAIINTEKESAQANFFTKNVKPLKNKIREKKRGKRKKNLIFFSFTIFFSKERIGHGVNL